MKYIRNPEIKIEIGICVLILVLSFVMGGCMGGVKGLAVAALTGFLFCCLHFVSSYYRYRRIQHLSERLNKFLHGYEEVQIGGQKEGELAVLESEIGKLILRLKNQAELLQKDKEYLADSIADISHQIRTPLTAMNLIVTRLSSKDMEVIQRKKLLKELESLLVHMDWLIQALLKISKLDAGTIQMKKSKVSLAELVQLSTESLEIPMELKNQSLLVDCQPAASFNGDLKWMKEALMNIVKNCMEHTPEGGIVKVKGSENALYTEIVVEDNGPGIEPEDLPHLFERFYKGKNSSEKSVGIGLALAKMIIQAQGGVISVENIGGKERKGAHFEIRFYKSVI